MTVTFRVPRKEHIYSSSERGNKTHISQPSFRVCNWIIKSHAAASLCDYCFKIMGSLNSVAVSLLSELSRSLITIDSPSCVKPKLKLIIYNYSCFFSRLLLHCQPLCLLFIPFGLTNEDYIWSGGQFWRGELRKKNVRLTRHAYFTLGWMLNRNWYPKPDTNKYYETMSDDVGV